MHEAHIVQNTSYTLYTTGVEVRQLRHTNTQQKKLNRYTTREQQRKRGTGNDKPGTMNWGQRSRNQQLETRNYKQETRHKELKARTWELGTGN